MRQTGIDKVRLVQRDGHTLKGQEKTEMELFSMSGKFFMCDKGIFYMG